MSNFSHSHDSESPAFEQLESLVRAAGGYVQPTSDLRPSVLEAAREACHQRRLSRRFGGLAVFILLIAATGLHNLLVSVYPAVASVHSGDLYHRAARSMVEDGTEANWALYEAFSDLRREHSARLPQPD